MARTSPESFIAPAATRDAYERVLRALVDDHAPFLVGGAFALAVYTGVERFTKDLDLFVRKRDLDRVGDTLRAIGLDVECFAPHWLSKAKVGDDTVDLIWSSGNGIAPVDDVWFERSTPGEVLGVPVRLCPPEEMIWSKASIMERERFDGADVAHLIHQQLERLDWRRLLDRFGENWRLLLVHLTLFGFVYPPRRASVPGWLMAELMDRVREEQRETVTGPPVCRGTILSRNQFALDVERWGYRDGRLPPDGHMSQSEIDLWEVRRREDQGDEFTV
jgi:putative nucleotidyltransferase-like protein